MDTEDAITTTKNVLRGFGLDDDSITKIIESGFDPDHDLISTDIAIKYVLTTLEERVGAIHPAPATVAILRKGPFGICLSHEYTTNDLNNQLADALSQTPYSLAITDGDGHDLSINFTDETGEADVTTTFSYPSTRLESCNFPAVATSINILLAEHSNYRIVLLRSVDAWSAIVVPKDRLGQVQDQYGDDLTIGGLAARDPDGLTEYLQTPVPDRYLDTEERDSSTTDTDSDADRDDEKVPEDEPEEQEDEESDRVVDSNDVDVPDAWTQDDANAESENGDTSNIEEQDEEAVRDSKDEAVGENELAASRDTIPSADGETTEEKTTVDENEENESSNEQDIDFVGAGFDFDSEVFEETGGEAEDEDTRNAEAGDDTEDEEVEEDDSTQPDTDSNPDSEQVLDFNEIPETAPEKDDRDQLDRQDPKDVPDVLDNVNVKESVKPDQGEFEEVTASVDLAAKLKEAERRLAEDEVLDWDNDGDSSGQSLTDPLVDTESDEEGSRRVSERNEENREDGEEEQSVDESQEDSGPEAHRARERSKKSGPHPNPDLVPEVQPGVDFEEASDTDGDDDEDDDGFLARLRDFVPGF